MKTLICLVVLMVSYTAHSQVLSINEKETKVNTKVVLKNKAYVIDGNNELLKFNPLLFGLNDSITHLKDTISYKSFSHLKEREKSFYIEAEPVFDINKITYNDYPAYLAFYRAREALCETKIDSLKSRQLRASTEYEMGKFTDSIQSFQKELESARNISIILQRNKNNAYGLFPSWNMEKRKAFFTQYYADAANDKTSFLNNFSYAFGSATVVSELISDYLSAVRVSFGSVLSTEAEQDDTADRQAQANATTPAAEEDLKAVINGGGNFYLNFQLPVYSYTSPTFSAFVASNSNLSANLKGIGQDVDTNNVRVLTNLSTYLSLSSLNKRFNFFASLDYGWLTGSNNFLEQFGIRNSDFFTRPPMLGKAIVGMTLENMVRIYVTTKSFSNYQSLVTANISVGIQLLK